MNINLPNIDYDYWLSIWLKNQKKDDSVYSNNNMKLFKTTFSNVKNAFECEQKIQETINKIDNFREQKQQVLIVVDLIYRWGGPSGRMFYAKMKDKKSHRENLENKVMIYDLYCDAIELAKNGKISSKFLFQSIPGIGSSFATKHAAFWSQNSKKPLIVLDSKIAGTLGYKTLIDLEKEIDYYSVLDQFSKEAKKKINSNEKTAQNLEKALFSFHSHYFLNENNGWHKKDFKNDKDFKVAIKIAENLEF
jgi:hypothetical protein